MLNSEKNNGIAPYQVYREIELIIPLMSESSFLMLKKSGGKSDRGCKSFSGNLFGTIMFTR